MGVRFELWFLCLRRKSSLNRLHSFLQAGSSLLVSLNKVALDLSLFAVSLLLKLLLVHQIDGVQCAGDQNIDTVRFPQECFFDFSRRQFVVLPPTLSPSVEPSVSVNKSIFSLSEKVQILFCSIHYSNVFEFRHLISLVFN